MIWVFLKSDSRVHFKHNLEHQLQKNVLFTLLTQFFGSNSFYLCVHPLRLDNIVGLLLSTFSTLEPNNSILVIQ